MRAPSALLLAIALTCPAPARGDDPAAEARAHFDAGMRTFEAGKYEDAVGEFEAAYRLKPNPDLSPINIGTLYERMYRVDEAREKYEQFLAEAPASSDLRPLAERRLNVLRALPGSVLVDTGVPGASVHLTGKEVDQTATVDEEAKPLPFRGLLPGRYQVHVTAAGYAASHAVIDLRPNENHALTQRLVREHASVTLFSSPDGARVFLDGLYVGETPYFSDIEVGPHRLRLELPDRAQRDLTFQLEPGRPYYRLVTLPPPPRSGRTEMALASMVLGGYAGAALTVAIGGNKVTTGTGGVAATAAVGVAGLALGFATSWLLTDDAMKVGHSSIISGGIVWGTFAALSLSYGLGLTADSGRGNSQQYPLALSLLGGGLGLGAGVLTARLTDTSAGDAAMVNSGALWGTASTTLLTEAISFRSRQHDMAFGWFTLGGNALGLVTGSLLARYFEVSRSHVAWIDLAGLLGSIVGYGVGYAAGHDLPDVDSGTICPGPVNRCVSGARYALGGMALGLITAAVLTRGLKYDLPRTEALLSHHDGRWALGLPAVRLGTALTPVRADQHAIVDLAKGEW